jgi:5'-nucleotidase
VNGVDKDVNAIVSAHTHLAYNHVIDGRPVVSAGQYGENMGLMDIKVDPATKKLLSITNEIKPLASQVADPKDPTKKIWVGNYPADPAVQAIVDAAKKKADELGAVSSATSPPTSTAPGRATARRRTAVASPPWATSWPTSRSGPRSGLRGHEPGWPARQPHLRGRHDRGDADGSVSYREALRPCSPSHLMTVKLTGAQVKQVLEQQWQPAGSARPFLKLGVSKELTYTYDPAAAAGSHITGIRVNGAPIDPAATYTVGARTPSSRRAATRSPRSSRAPTRRTPARWTCSRWSTGSRRTRRPRRTSLSARSAVLTAPADAAGYKAGESVTLNLSSLAFTAGEQAPGSVTVRSAARRRHVGGRPGYDARRL